MAAARPRSSPRPDPICTTPAGDIRSGRRGSAPSLAGVDDAQLERCARRRAPVATPPAPSSQLVHDAALRRRARGVRRGPAAVTSIPTPSSHPVPSPPPPGPAAAGSSAVDALDARRGRRRVRRRPATGPPRDRARGQGFCLFNNVAVAAAALVARGRTGASIVDWDVHHGNGTQDIFWDDPNVLYVSTHQSPAYPGTGRADETGGAQAPGLTLNFPLPPGATGDVALAASTRWWRPPSIASRPTWVLVSAGFDAHRADPLAELAWSAGDYALARHPGARARAGAGPDGRLPRGRLRPRRAPGVERGDRGDPRRCGARDRGADEWRSRARRDRADRARARGVDSTVEQRDDIVVARGPEIDVPLTDGAERLWGRDAHHRVGDVTELDHRRPWCDRGGDDDPARSLRAGHEDRGRARCSRWRARRRPGSRCDRSGARAARPARNRCARRSSSCCSRAATASSCPSVMRSASSTS